MNNMIKSTIIFLSGLTVGVLGSKLVFDKIYEDRYQNELESVKSIYKKESDHINKMHEDRVRGLVEAIEMSEDEVNTYRQILEANGYQIYTSDDVRNGKVPKFDNTSKYDQMLESAAPKDDAEEDEESEEVFEAAKVKVRNEEPYVINYEDFEHGAPDYDKLSLEYYSYDQVLIDEVGNVIDVDETVGRHAIDKLEHGSEDVIFVRNEWMEIDYEISLRDMAFDQHLGINRD